MRILGICFLILMLHSCDYFEKRKVYSDEILEESLKSFNWDDIDEYPFFINCDSTKATFETKRCFETTIADSIAVFLSQHKFVVGEPIRDTITMYFDISLDGKIEIDSIIKSQDLQRLIPELDSILEGSLNTLPELKPALKRGQPVNTKFQMPVIISSY